MEKFMEPEMELVTFDSEDVIMTSGGGCATQTSTGGPGICTGEGYIEEPW